MSRDLDAAIDQLRGELRTILHIATSEAYSGQPDWRLVLAADVASKALQREPSATGDSHLVGEFTRLRDALHRIASLAVDEWATPSQRVVALTIIARDALAVDRRRPEGR